ncbi:MULTISPECIES: DUF4169 family protein [Shimia]|uniref:DUF4169 family protein n=1 Tax=Shimia TaxID=573139 RepID=UPI001FB231E7|nr:MULTISPECIES: DUF4169 family protein [Shimia]MDV4144458.1 DUF4169 family protein [Shimia sp. FJ5]
MADPVNLNRFRKEKARAAKKARAQENSVKFGRTKAERARDESEAAKAKAHLDGNKRDEP